MKQYTRNVIFLRAGIFDVRNTSTEGTILLEKTCIEKTREYFKIVALETQ